MTFVESRGHRSSSFDFPPLAKRSTFAGTTASAKDIISQPVTLMILYIGGTLEVVHHS